MKSGRISQHDAAVFGGLHIGNGGLADSLELLLDNGSLVNVGEDLVHGVFIEHLRAVHALDELARSLALAEAGDHDVLADLGIRLVQRGLELVLCDLDSDLCASATPASRQLTAKRRPATPSFWTLRAS